MYKVRLRDLALRSIAAATLRRMPSDDLRRAVDDGEVDVLLAAGADADDEGKNGAPLMCAASHGDADVVRALLEAGARLDLGRSLHAVGHRPARGRGIRLARDR